MASILKVDKIVDSGSNVLATSSGSGYTGIPAAGITGTLGSGVTFPAGCIIGIENNSSTTIVESTSTTFTSIISDSITVSANSKVLIQVYIPVSSGGDSNPAGLQILQTGTASATILSNTEVYDEHHASAGGFFAGNFMSGVLSAGTYTFDAQGNRRSGSGTVYWISANPGPSSASIATITLMEIAG